MIKDDVQEILITEEMIIERCKELGRVIANDYQDEQPILVALLKGSVVFLAELCKHIDLPLEIDFLDVSSYEGTESTGDINIRKDLDRSIRDREILIIEDIVDTGRTLKTVIAFLYNKGARNIKVAALLDKKSRRVVEIEADYVGFDIPDHFVVGFGLDFNQKYRNLPFIGVLKKELYSWEDKNIES